MRLKTPHPYERTKAFKKVNSLWKSHTSIHLQVSQYNYLKEWIRWLNLIRRR